MTWVWIGFSLFILLMIGIDLLRKQGEVSLKEAAVWSAVWVSLALLFTLGIGLFWDSWHPDQNKHESVDKAIEFLTGYLVELSLSIDNLFVFLIIFRYFGVPEHLRHRCLMAGILFAIFLRVLFILVGAALLNQFHWIIYFFGAFLLYTAYKLFTGVEEEIDPDKNIMVRLVRRLVPVVTDLDSPHFWVWRDGKRHVTSLMLVLVVIETTDIVFALDSIPAIFGVTRDPFIVLTSNLFAVLGLRSFYFLLSRLLSGLRYLKPGLALVLGFVGLKMIVEEPLHDHLEAWGIGQRQRIIISLSVVMVILGGALIASLMVGPKKSELEELPHGSIAPGSPDGVAALDGTPTPSASPSEASPETPP